MEPPDEIMEEESGQPPPDKPPGELEFFCLERWIWILMNQWIIRMVACLHRLRDRQERRESDDWQGLRNHQCLFNYLRNVVLSIYHHEKVEMLDLLCLWMLR